MDAIRNARRSGAARRRRNGAVWVCGLVTLVGGCQKAPQTDPPMARYPQQILSGIESVNPLEVQRSAKRAYDAAGKKIEGLDVERFNAAVTEIAEAAAQLRERLEALPPASLAELCDNVVTTSADLRAEIAQADVAATAGELRRLSDTLRQQTEALDLGQMNGVVGEAGCLLEELRRTVEALQPQLTTAATGATRLVEQTEQRLAPLSAAELQRVVAELDDAAAAVQAGAAAWPATLRQLSATLVTVRMVGLVATGVLVLTGAAVAIHLLRMCRRPAA
jgi:hypothetical protein